VQLATASYAAWTPAMGVPVVASLGLPRWRPEAGSWARCWLITPRGRYFAASADVFDTEYLAQLRRFGARRIARELHAIGRGAERAVVLCFEADPQRCHRGLWAAWWLHNTGEPIADLTKEN
jgi:Protein of unknown function, DUF488